MNHQRGVVSWNDGANQDPLHELPRRHQNVKPVAAVLHARLQDLAVNEDTGVQAVFNKTLSVCILNRNVSLCKASVLRLENIQRTRSK